MVCRRLAVSRVDSWEYSHFSASICIITFPSLKALSLPFCKWHNNLGKWLCLSSSVSQTTPVLTKHIFSTQWMGVCVWCPTLMSILVRLGFVMKLFHLLEGMTGKWENSIYTLMSKGLCSTSKSRNHCNFRVKFIWAYVNNWSSSIYHVLR